MTEVKTKRKTDCKKLFTLSPAVFDELTRRVRKDRNFNQSAFADTAIALALGISDDEPITEAADAGYGSETYSENAVPDLPAESPSSPDPIPVAETQAPEPVVEVVPVVEEPSTIPDIDDIVAEPTEAPLVAAVDAPAEEVVAAEDHVCPTCGEVMLTAFCLDCLGKPPLA